MENENQEKEIQLLIVEPSASAEYRNRLASRSFKDGVIYGAIATGIGVFTVKFWNWCKRKIDKKPPEETTIEID